MRFVTSVTRASPERIGFAGDLNRYIFSFYFYAESAFKRLTPPFIKKNYLKKVLSPVTLVVFDYNPDRKKNIGVSSINLLFFSL